MWNAAMLVPSWPPVPRSVTVTEFVKPGATGIDPGATVSQLESEKAATNISRKQFAVFTVTVTLLLDRRSTVPGDTRTTVQLSTTLTGADLVSLNPLTVALTVTV